MFDKDQIGGNRETSILTNQLRSLQSIVENCNSKVGLTIKVDPLDRKDKMTVLNSIMESLMN